MKISLPYIKAPAAPELINYWHIDGDCIKNAANADLCKHARIVHAFLNGNHNPYCDVTSLRTRHTERQVSESEECSVHFYTREGYHSLNAVLRMKTGTSIHPVYQAHITNIERFIDKVAEPIPGPVFRVVTAAEDIDTFFRHVHPNDTLIDLGFTSTSKFPDLVKRLRGPPSHSNPLIYYRFENVTQGADFSAIRADQGEVLIQRKTPFEVKIMQKLSPYSLLVCLSEVDSRSSSPDRTKDLMTGQALTRHNWT